jgi:hypothetical protein
VVAAALTVQMAVLVVQIIGVFLVALVVVLVLAVAVVQELTL